MKNTISLSGHALVLYLKLNHSPVLSYKTIIRENILKEY